ncbi:hypothetical protein K474DRAFT_1674261 [Panus rudis PR-1116 ss-1]|nr:hypothetical protein K474DRAFT_1674261 [Panus rudis PR-1116 ss-1]
MMRRDDDEERRRVTGRRGEERGGGGDIRVPSTVFGRLSSVHDQVIGYNTNTKKLEPPSPPTLLVAWFVVYVAIAIVLRVTASVFVQSAAGRVRKGGKGTESRPSSMGGLSFGNSEKSGKGINFWVVSSVSTIKQEEVWEVYEARRIIGKNYSSVQDDRR